MPSNKKNNLRKSIDRLPMVKNIFSTLAFIAILLSLFAGVANVLFFHYPGNNYFPQGAVSVAISLSLMVWGFYLLLGQHPLYQISKELLYFFIVMALIALLTITAQWTPFQPIDRQIVDLETALGVDHKILFSWATQYPWFRDILALIYESLDYQMAFLPILMIISFRFSAVREYFFLLLFSAILGFSFYYFYPTTGPASILDNSLFTEAQKATGIKFAEIHHHQLPSTIEGGMIALPSFHVLWGWFCLYLCRGIPLLFGILFPVNLLLAISCVLLGWHYPSDLLASLILILLTHYAYSFVQNKGIRL